MTKSAWFREKRVYEYRRLRGLVKALPTVFKLELVKFSNGAICFVLKQKLTTKKVVYAIEYQAGKIVPAVAKAKTSVKTWTIVKWTEPWIHSEEII